MTVCFQGKYRFFFIACPRILMKSLQVCVLSKGRKNALRSLGKQVIGQGYIFSIHLQIFDEVNMQRRITFCVSNSSLCFCIIFDHEMVGGTFYAHEVLIHIHQVQLLLEWFKPKEMVQCAQKFCLKNNVCCVT